ncbi:MAG: AMP-binding protein [Candidatus Nanopelagicales bacterium]
MTQAPWLAKYPTEVNPKLRDINYPHLPALFREAAEKYADTIAFTQCMPNGMNGSLTYKRIDELSDNFAVYLRDIVKLNAGDRVAVQMPNCLSYPIVAFGVMKAGCVLVNTNPLYTATEMIHQFSDSGARALVIIDMFADRLPEVLPKTQIETVVTVKISEFFPKVVGGVIRLVQKVWNRSLPEIKVPHTKLLDALNAGQNHSKRQAVKDYVNDLSADSIATLQYTGGTTGVSKGAMLSHLNLIANTIQMIQMAGSFIRPGKETVITAIPLYHIFAFTVNLLGFFHVGARNIVIPNPRPPSNLKRAFENYKITWVTGVNTLYNALLKERWFLDGPPKHLRASVAGGMALHQSVATNWQEVTNTPLVEGFGLTESAPVLTFNPLDGSARLGTIGIPVPSTEIKLVDDSGNEVGLGEAGELLARGPQVMLGYWQNEKESANTIVDGWLKTGDIAEMDQDGFFTIVDRKKDVILVSGFNVYPNEVEERIADVPGVIEVGVVGLPDETLGEKVCAYVVANSPAPSQETILEHCREHLARYKVPKAIVFVDELPKSPIGKILRRELRSLAISEATSTQAKDA